jgi:hypothetical protein
MSAYGFHGGLLFPPIGLGGQGLEPVPFCTRPAHLLVELLIEHRVRVQCPDPVADLVQLVLVVGARDQDEPLDRNTERGGHDLLHRCIRHLHPRQAAAPFTAAPGVLVHR